MMICGEPFCAGIGLLVVPLFVRRRSFDFKVLFRESSLVDGRVRAARAWKRSLAGAAVLLWAGWAAWVIWLDANARLPLDWHGLWPADTKPQLRPTLLGMQDLLWGAATAVEEGNPAFSLGGDAAVLLGRWQTPVKNEAASFGAWIKIGGKLAQSNFVAMAGTAPPNEWGFGAWDGKFAAWFSELKTNGRATYRIVANDRWPEAAWVHVMVVVNSTRCTLWVNGQPAAEKLGRFGYPDDADVWLGAVRRTVSRFDILPLPGRFGGPVPEFLVDDFVVYARDLSESEIKGIAQAGRGGLMHARERLALRDQMLRQMTPAVALAGLLLLAFAYGRGLRSSLLRGTSYMLKREFVSTWIIFFLGSGTTIWITVRLAKSAAQADRERLDLFCERFFEAADTHFERIADLLRRARDQARLNPEISLTGWGRWAAENGLPYDFPTMDGIGWAPKVETKEVNTLLQGIQKLTRHSISNHWRTIEGGKWQLPVTGFRSGGIHNPAHPYAMVGWNFLEVLERLNHPDGPRAELLMRKDVASTSLVNLRPVPTEPAEATGVMLYLPVYKSPAPRPPRRNSYLVGVVFAGVRLADLVRGYWEDKPPLFGARLITGTPNSREQVALDSGEIIPESRRPAKPYLEREGSIRLYGRRIWVQVWTTPAFDAHSKRYWLWAGAVLGAFFTVLTTGLVAVQTRGRLQERQAAAEIRSAFEKLRLAERERHAISRDIHDGAIQSLYAMQLQFEQIAREADRARPAGAILHRIASAQSELDKIVAELRQFTVFDNSEPSAQERIGLCSVLRSFVERARASTSADVQFFCHPGAAAAVNDTQAVQLANIAREALSNSLRHAAAAEIRITLEPEPSGGGVRLEIADDGIGFNPETVPCRGLGLENMRARAQEAGGTFSIQSRPAAGTRISIRVPKINTGSNSRNDE